KDSQSYSSEYESQIEDNQTAVEELLKDRPEERRDEIAQRIQDEIDKGQAEINDGLKEIEEGKQALEDAEAELANARAELDEGWQEYENGIETFETEIADGQATIDQKRQELENARIEIINGKAELEVAQEELDESRAMLEQERANAETQVANSTAAIQNAQETIVVPMNSIPAQQQNTLLSGAQAISPEMTGLIRGYFDGTVPAQTVLDAVYEVEAASAEDESSENRESLAEWITLARSVVQIPGMSVSLNTQVQVVEQLRTMDVQLGDLMSQYYDG